jgi:hypothetical protein
MKVASITASKALLSTNESRCSRENSPALAKARSLPA